MARIVAPNPVSGPEGDRRPLPNVTMDPHGNQTSQRVIAPTNNASSKRSKKKLIVIVVVVLALGLYAKDKFLKHQYTPGAKVPAGQIFALGDTTITTNLSDGHLAQIGVSLQLTAPANSKLINADIPKLTSSTVEILGQQTYAGLLDPNGRQGLQSELLRAYQQDVGPSQGAQQISAVYFTSFVLQ